MNSVRIGIVGDHDPSILAHQAIPRALELAGASIGRPVQYEWLATDALTSSALPDAFAGLWCAPGSPYRSAEGALRAIRFAREAAIPFLGTCAGFQHAVLEYARSVLRWSDAEHAETAPQAQRPVIVALQCALVEARGTVHFVAGSRLARAYGVAQVDEGYHCRYGLNEALRAQLVAGPLRVAALDAAGEVRAVELDGHPFFVATLFQPERSALRGILPPAVAAFVRAAC